MKKLPFKKGDRVRCTYYGCSFFGVITHMVSKEYVNIRWDGCERVEHSVAVEDLIHLPKKRAK